MNKEQKNEYSKKKLKEWREKNPLRNKELRKKYKQSEKGRIANRRYGRSRFKKHPEKYKQSKEYINNYLKEYLKDEENHRKYLIRQKDNYLVRIGLLRLSTFCQLCGSKEKLEIYHKKYDESKDIIILCRKCHRRLHWKK